MLVLSRRPGEKVVIGNDIILTLVEVRGNRVRLALDAPDQVRILRAELACWQDDPLDADLHSSREWSSVCGSDLELEPARR
jgi:carbon storage regulator CsrA